MRSDFRLWRTAALTVAVVMVFAGLAYADTFGQVFWQDDFQDGDYTNNPTWTPFGGGTWNVATTDIGGGEYALDLTATHIPGGGWAGAYVNYIESNQGISGWLRAVPPASDDWTSLVMLRYTPTATVGIGTGYALAVGNSASFGMVAQLYQLNDLLGYSTVTDPVLISPTTVDLWVRFYATGSGANTSLRGRVWADGSTEPFGWQLDSGSPGSTAGVTNYYGSGVGGVGLAAVDNSVTGRAYFDNVTYGTPEPATMALMVTGIGALILRRRRQA